MNNKPKTFTNLTDGNVWLVSLASVAAQVMATDFRQWLAETNEVELEEVTENEALRYRAKVERFLAHSTLGELMRVVHTAERGEDTNPPTQRNLSADVDEILNEAFQWDPDETELPCHVDF